MIPANGAPHDLEARDVHRNLSFAQRRARDNSHGGNNWKDGFRVGRVRNFMVVVRSRPAAAALLVARIPSTSNSRLKPH
jgi:hypothetical protein